MIKAPTNAYGLLAITGIALSFLTWRRLAGRDPRLLYIYFSALGGAFFGAKVVYLAAEGWMRWHEPDRWLQLATGKTILGGLLGGYAGVEIAKYCTKYRSTTGDWFALITPISIILGRLGCYFHGCCVGVPLSPHWFTLQDAHGVSRWPSVPVEISFNAVMLIVLFQLHRRSLFTGQLFHLYLISYGLFRFVHEFLRQEPHILGPFSGYHFAAVAVCVLGLFRFAQRQRRGQVGRGFASIPTQTGASWPAQS